MNGIGALRAFARLFHIASFMLLAALALALLFYTCLSALGITPWLTLPLHFGEIEVENGGLYVQSAVTLLGIALLAYLPSNFRVLQLEKSHRDFHLNMEDVARAYQICHHADRQGVFSLSSEFDAVRERLSYLRDHPDLARLESDVLTLAAQMSEKSRDIAEIYSDAKVARAKKFLSERQREIEDQQERIIDALHICDEVRKWKRQIEAEEDVLQRQLARLDKRLRLILPDLGYDFEREERSNVVQLASKPAAE